jgi:diadenosine tetraphosphatase ApaH/serine/threonine PP2A family protein phosphatase
MKYALFSDMHGNLEAYKAVADELEGEKGIRYFCIGDIVGYGADPKPCIRLTRKLDPVIVCGNHDWASVGLTSVEYFNEHAKKAVLWTASELGKRDADYLRSLDLIYKDRDMTLVHGTLMNPELFNYVFDLQTARRMMELMTTRVGFIGHSHVPGIFIMNGDSVEYTEAAKVNMRDDRRYLVNVGSVGQPRDGDPRASFCVWDRDAGTVEIKRAVYDVGKAQMKIREAGLPDFLARRLGEGR